MNFFHVDKFDYSPCPIVNKFGANVYYKGLLFALWFFLASSMES